MDCSYTSLDFMMFGAAGEVEFLDARLDPAASAAASNGEARNVFTSGGQYFVALNTTVVLWSVISLVGGLFALLSVVSLADKKKQALLSNLNNVLYILKIHSLSRNLQCLAERLLALHPGSLWLLSNFTQPTQLSTVCICTKVAT